MNDEPGLVGTLVVGFSVLNGLWNVLLGMALLPPGAWTSDPEGATRALVLLALGAGMWTVAVAITTRRERAWRLTVVVFGAAALVRGVDALVGVVPLVSVVLVLLHLAITAAAAMREGWISPPVSIE